MCTYLCAKNVQNSVQLEKNSVILLKLLLILYVTKLFHSEMLVLLHFVLFYYFL